MTTMTTLTTLTRGFVRAFTEGWRYSFVAEAARATILRRVYGVGSSGLGGTSSGVRVLEESNRERLEVVIPLVREDPPALDDEQDLRS